MNDNAESSKKTTIHGRACIPFLIASLSLTYVPPAIVHAAEAEIHYYVRDFSGFMGHTQQHIANVQSLGKFAYFYWAAEFANLPPNLLTNFLEIHDMAKVADIHTLRMFGFKGQRALGEQLYEYYGKDLNALPEAEKIKFKELINEVNRIDTNIRVTFFKTNGLLKDNGFVSPLIQSLLKIEKLADLTERSINPVSEEEFNKEMKSARDFFEDNADRKKAIILEAYYHRVVKNNFLLNRCGIIHNK